MPEYHSEIRKLLDDKWIKTQINQYYIFLEKDGICKKLSLQTGKLISETKIVQTRSRPHK